MHFNFCFFNLTQSAFTCNIAPDYTNAANFCHEQEFYIHFRPFFVFRYFRLLALKCFFCDMVC